MNKHQMHVLFTFFTLFFSYLPLYDLFYVCGLVVGIGYYVCGVCSRENQ